MVARGKPEYPKGSRNAKDGASVLPEASKESIAELRIGSNSPTSTLYLPPLREPLRRKLASENALKVLRPIRMLLNEGERDSPRGLPDVFDCGP